MNEMQKQISAIGCVPVIKLNNPQRDAAPLSDAKLLAVGGVNKDNVRSFLQEGFCGVGVGSSLYDEKLIAKQDWIGLKELAENYISSVKKA
jgi:2-dehydro-3-deoxyphosphogluconate aldolase/(4S)-4-hydroxy-2-oxoglutarate aldolase